MYTYDVAISDYIGEWDQAYTANRLQQSDNGEFIAITGIRNGSVMGFDSYIEMLEYCYFNGWTKPTEI